MTPEQINIAIAESVGYTRCVCGDPRCGAMFPPESETGEPCLCPDYCNDLNAMHEVEKTLTPEQEEDYVDRLGKAIMQTAYEDDKRWMESNLSSFDSTYRATANQRAEAYLRTIGKWKK